MRAIDLTDQHFGWLTAISRQGIDKSGNALWLCHCKCGKEVLVAAESLRSGSTQSCGCLRSSADFRRKMREASAKGVAASVSDGIQIASARRKEPNANSSTGVRGVAWNTKRQYYTASAQLHGERHIKAGIKSLEEAKVIREQLRAELEEKYNFDP